MLTVQVRRGSPGTSRRSATYGGPSQRGELVMRKPVADGLNLAGRGGLSQWYGLPGVTYGAVNVNLWGELQRNGRAVMEGV